MCQMKLFQWMYQVHEQNVLDHSGHIHKGTTFTLGWEGFKEYFAAYAKKYHLMFLIWVYSLMYIRSDGFRMWNKFSMKFVERK